MPSKNFLESDKYCIDESLGFGNKKTHCDKCELFWVGTSPFCNGDCKLDSGICEAEIVKSSATGDGHWCLTGNKQLCRNPKKCYD